MPRLGSKSGILNPTGALPPVAVKRHASVVRQRRGDHPEMSRDPHPAGKIDARASASSPVATTALELFGRGDFFWGRFLDDRKRQPRVTWR